MSTRILYVERADRGDRLAALRLIGPRTSDVWHPTDTSSLDAAINAVRDGAAWVRQRLASTGDRATLASLCLDPDGALCSWITAPSSEPTILHAIARGVSADGHDAEHDEAVASVPSARLLDHFSSVGAGMSLQSLTPAAPTNGHDKSARQPTSRRRLAVLGTPDSAAGILVDTLDTLGIPAPPAISLWHAMAQAWDPASPANARADAPRADRLVADEIPVTAIILIEPQGRLTWAWSRSGTLLTGGSMRLPRSRADNHAPADAARPLEHTHLARLDHSHAARLAAEWLSWSAQTGDAPARVIVLAPDRLPGLTPSDLAGSLVKAWPGAIVDLVSEPDPVTLTLRRVLEDDSASTPDSSILSLATRPTRAHRSMYVWSALAIVGLALGAGTVAVKSWRTAADARARAQALRTTTRAMVATHYDDPTAAAAGIIITLEDELARLQAQDAPADSTDFKPVLPELENISLVVSSLIASSPRSEFASISLDNLTGVSLTMRFPDVGSFESFRAALPEAGISELTWDPTSATEVRGTNGTQLEARFTARWKAPRAGNTP